MIAFILRGQNLFLILGTWLLMLTEKVIAGWMNAAPPRRLFCFSGRVM